VSGPTLSRERSDLTSLRDFQRFGHIAAVGRQDDLVLRQEAALVAQNLGQQGGVVAGGDLAGQHQGAHRTHVLIAHRIVIHIEEFGAPAWHAEKQAQLEK
jgi:hypothetical protein